MAPCELRNNSKFGGRLGTFLRMHFGIFPFLEFHWERGVKGWRLRLGIGDWGGGGVKGYMIPVCAVCSDHIQCIVIWEIKGNSSYTA